MLNLFKKKTQKDPICGMEIQDDFISKYGKKFCSKSCVKKYEEQNHIYGGDNKKNVKGCCH